MGNSGSSSRAHDESVDFGALVPQAGVYTGPRDWNQSITAQLIIARRLAPFYRPLEDYDESWDDDHILAARKPLPDADNEQQPPSPPPPPTSKKRSASLKEPSRPEAAVYRHAVECPICFLYYPPNINHSRCCDQAICTECFVQIKRNEPTATHLVSEPAACPYCVQENFGVVYTPPPWKAGIGSDGGSLWSDSPRGTSPSVDTPYPTHKRRQKSFGADSPEVVLIDHIRPDWEAKLAAVRAAVQRRANRRIIMRQVGDRLIPVGVTSGRVHTLTPEEAAQAAEAQAAEGNNGSGSRRSRRRQQAPNGNFEQFMGMGGAELEELMLMEAMRLSLLEHEEQQRKEAEEKKKAASTEATNGASSSTAEANTSADASLAVPSSTTPPRSPSTLSVSKPSSRSRSPSPNPLQAIKDTASGWRRRGSSPPPVTLSAALSAVSTVSAVLNASESPSDAAPAESAIEPAPAEPTSVPIATEQAAEPVASEPAPTPPTIVEPIVTHSDATPTAEPTTNPVEAAVVKSALEPSLASAPKPEIQIPATRPIARHSDTMMSAVSAASSVGETYDNLPSSPDSDSFVDREPLLTPEGVETPQNAAKDVAAPAEGYFGDASTTTRE
uniref:RING-type domain-containing protein n=1 Tax=Mycena chlorophos TaxID=658473 RepID=A0ABQ0KZ05_MYCCL|nr:predicted protein [Mycena chlorophos]